MSAGHGNHKVDTVTRNEINLSQNMCLAVQYMQLNYISFNSEKRPASFFKTTHRENKMGAVKKKATCYCSRDCRIWLYPSSLRQIYMFNKIAMWISLPVTLYWRSLSAVCSNCSWIILQKLKMCWLKSSSFSPKIMDIRELMSNSTSNK